MSALGCVASSLAESESFPGTPLAIRPVLNSATLALKRFPLASSCQEMALERSSIPAMSRRIAPQRGAMRLDIPGIELRSSAISWHDEASGNRFKASVAEFKTGRIASGVPGKLSLSARLEATQPKADIQIKLSGGYRLDLEKQAVAPSGLGLKISDVSGSTAPPISLPGNVVFDSAPQAIRFDLSVDRLDLDRTLPPPAKAGASAAKASPGGGSPSGAVSGTRPEEPIDLSALKGLNLKGGLKIDRLVASNVKMDRVHLGIQAAGGKAELGPLS